MEVRSESKNVAGREEGSKEGGEKEGERESGRRYKNPRARLGCPERTGLQGLRLRARGN